jgi:hypothetical protein
MIVGVNERNANATEVGGGDMRQSYVRCADRSAFAHGERFCWRIAFVAKPAQSAVLGVSARAELFLCHRMHCGGGPLMANNQCAVFGIGGIMGSPASDVDLRRGRLGHGAGARGGADPTVVDGDRLPAAATAPAKRSVRAERIW